MTTTAPTLSTAPTISTVTAAPGDAGPGRMKRLVRGRPADPAWVRPSLFALLIGTAFLYIWGLGRFGLGELVLLGGRSSRLEELEGVLLRLFRCRKLHHGRQAAGVAVGHGPLGARLRGERLEHSGAAGP